MYKRFTLTLVISIIIVSCSPKIEFHGEEYPPTDSIIVLSEAYLYGDSIIEKDFDIIGYIDAFGSWKVSRAKMRSKLIEEAQKRGADAVAIEDLGSVTTTKMINRNYNHPNSYNRERSVNEKKITGTLIRFKK